MNVINIRQTINASSACQVPPRRILKHCLGAEQSREMPATGRGSLLGLENFRGHEKGDGTDKAGEDHSPCDVHDHYDERPVFHQRVVRQLIGLVGNETKEEAQ